MRVLIATAAVNIALHIAGLVCAATGMRPGSPLVGLDERMAYLASHPWGWSAGWAVWMLCALALVAFLIALRPLARDRDLASLALMLAILGAAVDFACDVGQMLVLPDLAALRPPQPALFLAWERWLGATGAIVANGLYSLAVVLAAYGLKDQTPSHVFALGVATAVAGLLIVLAGFTGDPRHLELAVGPTIVGFVLWTAATTRALARSR